MRETCSLVVMFSPSPPLQIISKVLMAVHRKNIFSSLSIQFLIFLSLLFLTMQCSWAGIEQEGKNEDIHNNGAVLGSSYLTCDLSSDKWCFKVISAWNGLIHTRKRQYILVISVSLKFKSIYLTYSLHAILKYSQGSVMFRGFVLNSWKYLVTDLIWSDLIWLTVSFS